MTQVTFFLQQKEIDKNIFFNTLIKKKEKKKRVLKNMFIMLIFNSTEG